MTKFTVLPSCLYHPLSVIFLDDNQSFLDAIKLGMENSDKILTCTSSKDALSLISLEDESIISKVSSTCSDVDTDNTNKRVVDIDIGSIRNAVYNESRFKHIGVVVVDYKMPKITGTEFCRQIKDRHIYKVMLTAEAAMDVAIDAFNEGVINKFLLKNCDNLHAHLACVISELEEKYFFDISKPILNSLDESLSAMLKSKVFIELFNSVFYEANAVEYYLLDTSGSYLFLDGEGNATWLIIRTESDFIAQLEALSGLEAPESLVEALDKRQKLLFMLSEDEYEKSVDDWGNNLFEAKKLTNSIWYSIQKGQIKDAINWHKVKPYHGF